MKNLAQNLQLLSASSWLIATVCFSAPLVGGSASELSSSGQTRAEFQVGSSKLEIFFAQVPSENLRQRLLEHLHLSARAVALYYGHFPVENLHIDVNLRPGRGLGSGKAFGGSEPQILLAVGRESSEKDFAEDWVSTHEMVHLAFPSVDEQHHWIEEGLAVYVEPIARARVGELTAQKIWGDMLKAMPQGQPQSGDRGLDFTHTWARTYWGGALFCLLADVEIRRRTANKKGLEHALRAVLNEVGNIQSNWPLERAIEAGDRATGVPVLQDLFAKMKASAVTVDLDDLWRKLGVHYSGSTTAFDDSAPQANIRKAITEP
jgi:hypothetical protein